MTNLIARRQKARKERELCIATHRRDFIRHVKARNAARRNIVALVELKNSALDCVIAEQRAAYAHHDAIARAELADLRIWES